MTKLFSSNDSDNFNKIWEIHEPEEALAYLRDPKRFPPFSHGLTDFMKKCGYLGPTDPESVEEKTEYLWTRLHSLDRLPTKSTIRDWFRLEERRPSMDARSRAYMFRICFALSASLEDVDYFFNYIYLGRSFNCHTREEAVYYYGFFNQLTYEHAQDLLRCIERFPKNTLGHSEENIFTNNILKRLKKCRSDEALLSYFEKNNYVFEKWNVTASTEIQHLREEIQGHESDKQFLKFYQTKKDFSLKDIAFKDLESCGLIIQEHLINKSRKETDDISHDDITSTAFMLKQILLTKGGLPKKADIHAGVRKNFPNAENFSRIIDEPSTSTSYDLIRKTLILLKFYHFWATRLRKEALHEDSPAAIDVFEQYKKETNDLLFSCRYGDLFLGNPYDWLFLWASSTEDPLESLRSVICCILDED